MKQIYVISLFFLPFWCFSQLYIKPNGNKESFLYARGGMVFVQKDIYLAKNPPGQLEASFYLRNEAQLLQGAEDSKNSGTGVLSVFQEGKATAYTYNYWSSPVENISGNSSFGNIFYEPLDLTHSRKAIITQELNGHANPLKISGRWIYKLSGSAYSDWEYVGNNFNVNPGEGFTMKGVDGTNTEIKLYGVDNNPGNEQRYDFRGRPHTGTIALDINKNEILLVGNPYPSALDLNMFLEENTTTTGIAYFWDSRPVSSHYLKDYEGGYGAYSPALGRNGYVPAVFKKYDELGNPVSETGRTGEYYARGFSPLAQGFIVEGLATGKVYFRNRYREFQKENPQLSEFKLAEAKIVEIPLIRLNIEFKGKYVRQLILAKHGEATTGADRSMDAKNLSPLETDAGWKLNNDIYLIDVRDDFHAPVPLSIITTRPEEITLTLAEVNHISGNIYVWDSVKNIYYNLKDQEITIPVTEGINEDLSLTFSKKLQEGDENKGTGKEYQIFQNNAFNRAEVISAAGLSIETIGIIDSRGRKIKEIKATANDMYHEIYTGNLSRGIYIIKITSGDGIVVSKKVIISN
ncbi:T9SS type A sorting domain-containing protein [Antarcticibacterium arcticum]|uniref:T9SS type A sorting domain-containing protein n=1 Tax=Antarcticibacterium arcticum TaxID=2585771 RepID=A0A5B8YFN6_9FLAO|nr:T9SS type A sorting domain-containing protein [Antarcticibacterium arcticum]QED36760.1 T9SS type A sorting domain-containing protein [Antarcticibacterium arcticum]